MVAVVLGSAFGRAPEQSEGSAAMGDVVLGGRALAPVDVGTRFGNVTLHRWSRPAGDEAWVLFRHGFPHRWLPNQINWRAQAAALAEVGAGSVVLQSSVGVMDAEVPLFEPLLARDLLMLDNRLPDGTQCTLFTEPADGQGHLVIEGGLFDEELGDQLAALAHACGAPVAERVTFTYVPGPRTKTAAENALLAQHGGQTNSMTVGPEVVLLNELGLSVAALLVGHKHSLGPSGDGSGRRGGRASTDVGQAVIDASLVKARAMTEALVTRFLDEGTDVPWKNRLHVL